MVNREKEIVDRYLLFVISEAFRARNCGDTWVKEALGRLRT